MKTKITFAILSLLLNIVLFAGGNISAAATGEDTLAMTTHSFILPAVEDESYINDIPFDTEAIAIKSLFMNLERPEDEAYVNDIPFNTAEVVANYNFLTNNIQPDEEEYIDDIPFNTADVVEDYINSGCSLAVKEINGKCIE
ncbi:MAG TPA: hypothetical protein VK212_07115 [Lentimicrobium sp.]|nr:hypothetical protein [Lentimicrobium sp.]